MYRCTKRYRLKCGGKVEVNADGTICNETFHNHPELPDLEIAKLLATDTVLSNHDFLPAKDLIRIVGIPPSPALKRRINRRKRKQKQVGSGVNIENVLANIQDALSNINDDGSNTQGDGRDAEDGGGNAEDDGGNVDVGDYLGDDEVMCSGEDVDSAVGGHNTGCER